MTAQNPRATLSGLQILRALAALMVMIYHTGYVLDDFYGFQAVSQYLRFGAAGVEIFFVISGFIIWHVHANDIGRADRAGRYAWRRFARIYPAYWIITLCVLVPALLVPGLVSAEKLSAGHISESFLLVGFGFSQEMPILPQGWSLFHEVKFYLFFLLLIFMPKVVGRVLCWVVSILTLLFVVMRLAGGGGDASGLTGFYLSEYNFLFLGGAVVAHFLARSEKADGWRWSLAGGGVVFVFLALAEGLGVPVAPMWRILGYGACGVLFVRGMVRIPEGVFVKAGVFKPMKFLGNASYSLYLIHIPVFEVFARVVRAEHPVFVTGLWLAAAMLGCGLLAGCGFYLFVEKPLLRLTRKGPSFVSER